MLLEIVRGLKCSRVGSRKRNMEKQQGLFVVSICPGSQRGKGLGGEWRGFRIEKGGERWMDLG